MNSNVLQKLLKEACGLKGMIAEVACKSRILANSVKSGADDSEVSETLSQMQSDLDKYSERLEEIFAELDTYELPKLE